MASDVRPVALRWGSHEELYWPLPLPLSVYTATAELAASVSLTDSCGWGTRWPQAGKLKKQHRYKNILK